MTDAIKILTIDDSEDDRLLYSRALQKNPEVNYLIFEADNGEEGLRCIEEDSPACVLLDYSMPGYDGIEILKRIRAGYPFIPVVMMTGQGNEKVAVSAIQEGAQNYLSKSDVTPETLQRIIRVAIEHCAMQKRIHEQRTALEIFTRAMAHDLKEPMRTIRSFTEMIVKREQFSGKTLEFFTHVQTAAERMQMLIDTVFLYTQLDIPEYAKRDSCDMREVLGEVSESVSSLIRERSATIECGALPHVQANRTQLGQLLQNLVCNAIKHSPNPVTIRIEAAEQADHWLVTVKDNGSGIAEEYLRKIFEPFQRLKAHHEGAGGAGLGLAISRKIVDLHGGRIWCESRPGEGAAFRFTLPKGEASQPAQPTALPDAVPPPETLSQEACAPLANVLLVDDRMADLEVARLLLFDIPQLRCNLFTAQDGGEALAALHEKSPIDLMLLDINMPEVNGLELLERMRGEDALKQVTVVMCTGSTYNKDMETARALGAAGYLVKPVSFEMLQSVIANARNVHLQREGEGYALLRTNAAA